MRYCVLTHPCAGKSTAIENMGRDDLYEHRVGKRIEDFPDGSIIMGMFGVGGRGGVQAKPGRAWVGVVLDEETFARNLRKRQDEGEPGWDTREQIDPIIEKILEQVEQRGVPIYRSIEDAVGAIDKMGGRI
jgi:hypothetical protein